MLDFLCPAQRWWEVNSAHPFQPPLPLLSAKSSAANPRMFRAVASVAKRSAPLYKAVNKPSVGQFRTFSEKLDIPTDSELQAGRRKDEIDAEVAGQVGFNRDPIIPDINAGTKENPILVS
ncbi:hypothetical protein EON65_13965 [archaeon]|nr:MAG: hypothetical protein EON65_13965 [archaeon]